MADITGSKSGTLHESEIMDYQETLYYEITIDKIHKQFTVDGEIIAHAVNKVYFPAQANRESNQVFVRNLKTQEKEYEESKPYIIHTEGGETINSVVVTFTTTLNYDKDGSKRIRIYASYIGGIDINLPNLSSCNTKVSGVWKKTFPFIKVNGDWKRCTMWKKISGVWKRGI